MSRQLPAPLFKRFERVRIIGERPQSKQYEGEQGVIVWLDSYYIRLHSDQPNMWTYIVYLPTRGSWRSFLQSDLESSGEFDLEADHLGEQQEISFDTVLEEDNAHVEGSYRLPGKFWQVVVFQKGDVPDIQHESSRWQKPSKWEQEITGIVITIPHTTKVDRECLLWAISQATGYGGWREVSGPDSIVLR